MTDKVEIHVFNVILMILYIIYNIIATVFLLSSDLLAFIYIKIYVHNNYNTDLQDDYYI